MKHLVMAAAILVAGNVHAYTADQYAQAKTLWINSVTTSLTAQGSAESRIAYWNKRLSEVWETMDLKTKRRFTEQHLGVSKVKQKFNQTSVTATDANRTSHRNYRNIAGTKKVTEYGCDYFNTHCSRTTKVKKHRTRGNKYQVADFIITERVQNENYVSEEKWNTRIDTNVARYECSLRWNADCHFNNIEEKRFHGVNASPSGVRLQAATDYAHEIGITGKGAKLFIYDDFAGENAHGDIVRGAFEQLAPNGEVWESERVAGWGLYNWANLYNVSSGFYSRYSHGSPFNRLNRNKVLVTVAAGNEGKACDRQTTCNALATGAAWNSTAIVVGELNGAGTGLEPWSNKAGLTKDHFLAAPTMGHNGFSIAHGTSFAAPVVAGAAALVMDRFGTNAKQTKHILLESADDLGAPGVDEIYGHGALNLKRALSPAGAIN